MRTRLTIGEAARLAGVTPKAIRHYQKLGLLEEPERSEAGYRLYLAEALLRLARIRRLRSLGLSLKRVGDVLGDPDDEKSLKMVLEALLAGGDLEEPGKPDALKLAEEHLAEHLSEASSALLSKTAGRAGARRRPAGGGRRRTPGDGRAYGGDAQTLFPANFARLPAAYAAGRDHSLLLRRPRKHSPSPGAQAPGHRTRQAGRNRGHGWMRSPVQLHNSRRFSQIM